ncbi:MAG: TetR/AcrR family transcriptional regulator [Terriglobales bacterium]
MTPSSASASAPVAPPAGRRERRRAETKERIFRAALQLFGEHGFSATTVEDITEAADVGKGTFFNYFSNKEDVLGALAEVQLDKYSHAIEAAESGALSPREALRELWLRLPEEPGRSQALVRSLMVVFLTSSAIREKMSRSLKHGREMLARLFVLAQERAEAGSGRRPHELALAFQQKLLGTVLVWTLDPPTPLRPVLEASFKDFWIGAGDRAAKPKRSAPRRKERRS